MQSDLLRFDHTFGARIGIHPETFPRRIIGHGEGDHPLLEMQGSTGVLGCYRFIIHQNLTAGLNADGRHGTACVAHGCVEVAGALPNPALAFSALVLLISQPSISLTWVQPESSSFC